MRRGLLSLVLAVFLSPAAALAAEPEAAWRVTPDPMRVGDRIEAELEVIHDAGSVIQWGDPAFEGLELASQATFPADSVAAEREVTRRRFSLYADLPGTFRLPRMELTVTGEGGVKTVTVAALALPVAGAFDPESPPEKPAPARGTVAAPFPWGWVMAGLLLLAALAGAGVWAARRFRPPPPPPPAPVPVYRPPAHRVALDHLKQLERAGGPPRQTMLAISRIVRTYLADGFGIDAPTQSSLETGILVAERGDPALSPVPGWLIQWDLVRFARAEPDEKEVGEALRTVREWVRETTPATLPRSSVQARSTVSTGDAP